MPTRIRKWGNSLGVRLPKALAEQAGLEDGTEVEVLLRDGNLVIEPTRQGDLRLDDLLERVTPGNRHGELDSGPAVGREAW